MGLPSASSSAGAVPAFRAASRSFCRLNSSFDNFPTAENEAHKPISRYLTHWSLLDEAIFLMFRWLKA